MAENSLLTQLKERHVIRATLIYVAFLWVALQVADLLAEAEMLGEQHVRWIILLGVAGLPITILASWFFETPWKHRRWIAVAGDLTIIIAVTLAAALFAWQQWFTSFTRPTVAVLTIEATDTRADSEDLAAHLALRLRTALATRPELRVIELSSSQHEQLDGLSIVDKAARLQADYLLAGTVAQSGSQVRLNVQLFGNDGDLVSGETFEDRLLDQAQLQNRVIAALWSQLPLPQDGLAVTRKLIADCEYPDNREALLAITAIDNDDHTGDLTEYLAAYPDAGMLQIANSKKLFVALAEAEPTRKPILQPIAMQSLATIEELCRGAPNSDILRLLNTREIVDNESLRRHPNSAALYRRASEQNSEPQRANAFLDEARLLDPLGGW